MFLTCFKRVCWAPISSDSEGNRSRKWSCLIHQCNFSLLRDAGGGTLMKTEQLVRTRRSVFSDFQPLCVSYQKWFSIEPHMHRADGDSEGSPHMTRLTCDSSWTEQVVISLMDWRTMNTQTKHIGLCGPRDLNSPYKVGGMSIRSIYMLASWNKQANPRQASEHREKGFLATSASLKSLTFWEIRLFA